ncbi:hypothetical protein AB1N83_013821 [Pleurotus pulmonarius]
MPPCFRALDHLPPHSSFKYRLNAYGTTELDINASRSEGWLRPSTRQKVCPSNLGLSFVTVSTGVTHIQPYEVHLLFHGRTTMLQPVLTGIFYNITVLTD